LNPSRTNVAFQLDFDPIEALSEGPGIRIRIEKKIGKSSVVPIPDPRSKCWGLAILRRGVESEIAADP